MIELANLVAQALHRVVFTVVTRPGAGRTRRFIPYGWCEGVPADVGMDWHADGHRLIVWRQDFPGADLDVISDVTAPLMAHYR